MKRISGILIAACMALAACTAAAPSLEVGAGPPIVASPAPVAAPAADQAPSLVILSTRVEQAQGLYDRTKAFVDLFLPYMPEHRAAQVRAAGAMVEKALYAARIATTLAAQAQALKSVDASIAQFKFISGG